MGFSRIRSREGTAMLCRGGGAMRGGEGDDDAPQLDELSARVLVAHVPPARCVAVLGIHILLAEQLHARQYRISRSAGAVAAVDGACRLWAEGGRHLRRVKRHVRAAACPPRAECLSERHRAVVASTRRRRRGVRLVAPGVLRAAPDVARAGVALGELLRGRQARDVDGTPAPRARHNNTRLR